MSWVVFENDGEIDVRAVRTFGISVKDKENPIGFFGTGLKYAIAILLRDNHLINISSGDKNYFFKEKDVNVRGKDFKVVAMNDEELSFTTRVGVNWEMWQAFRELYCNCLDESGKVYLAEMPPTPQAGKTFVSVQGDAFRAHFHERDTIVLKLPEPMLVSDGKVQIYDKEARHLYYRGIRVEEFGNGKKSIFTYNVIADQMLTEDRTLRFAHYAYTECYRAIARMTDKAMIRKAILCDDDRDMKEKFFNYTQLLSMLDEISQEFMEVVGLEYEANNDLLVPAVRSFYMEVKAKRSYKSKKSEKLTDVEKKQLDRAKLVCKKVYPDFDHYPIIVVLTLGQNTHAFADMEEKTIVLSKICFERGTKYLVSTLIEEYTHLKTGYDDHTRQLQAHLFDQITTLVEAHVIQEPI